MQIEDDLVQKKFGSYKILWKVEHFFLLTCENNWIISSPTFSLRDPFHTTWKLILKAEPNGNNDEENFLCASLWRLETDTGPELVQANWKISFLNGNTNEYSFAENEYCFGRNMSCTVNVLSMKDVLKELQPFETDVLYLQCRLIVSHKNRNAFSICTHQGIKLLSENLLKLYTSRTMSDMVLKLRDEYKFDAHKAVLHARNPTLASIFDSRPESWNSFNLFLSDEGWSEAAVLHTSMISSGAVEKVISYLYSGDLDLVVGKPSVSIYECAILFDISEIVDYYTADELTIQSTINVGELVFVWTIKNFESINSEHISSAPLTEDTSQSVWRLRFFPYGRRNQEGFVSIFAKIIGGITPQNFCLEFAIMNLSREIVNRKRLQKSAKHGNTFGFSKFSSRDNLSSSLDEDGTLHIIFKLRISTTKPVSSLGSSSVTIVTPISKEEALKSLSVDMVCLFQERKYSDAVIRCNGKVFEVHKFIFASGSDTFSKMVWDELQKTNEIRISYIKPKVLRVMLIYMYSGTIPNSSYEVICDVYKNAETYHMYGLMNKCLQRYNPREK